jgi:site-specific DNA-cytosine methylase
LISALDLFSAAAGGWTLGLHRAGFRTLAACEAVDWRRALYAENNPGIPIYDDVRTITAARLLDDLGRLPDIVVGSPPCQDISSANTKGKGVHGERSGLFFEAVRIIGECRPRWFALENSANLRTRGADAVISALEALGYTCWSFVVRAGDIGANHERARSWLIGCDLEQVADADGDGWTAQWSGRRAGSTYPFRMILATPRASDMKAGGHGDTGRTGTVRHMLATPRKTDADRGFRGNTLSQLQGHASRHAGMLPTPRKSDAHHGPDLRNSRGERTNGTNLPTFLHTPTAKANLHAPAMKKWPSCVGWAEIANPETLPTPTKRDKRMDAWSPAYDKRKSPTMDAVMDGAMTGKASDKWTYARMIAAILTEHGLSGASMTLPVVYGWMMGYPPAWLERALLSALQKGHLLRA